MEQEIDSPYSDLIAKAVEVGRAEVRVVFSEQQVKTALQARERLEEKVEKESLRWKRSLWFCLGAIVECAACAATYLLFFR